MKNTTILLAVVAVLVLTAPAHGALVNEDFEDGTYGVLDQCAGAGSRVIVDNSTEPGSNNGSGLKCVRFLSSAGAHYGVLGGTDYRPPGTGGDYGNPIYDAVSVSKEYEVIAWWYWPSAVKTHWDYKHRYMRLTWQTGRYICYNSTLTGTSYTIRPANDKPLYTDDDKLNLWLYLGDVDDDGVVDEDEFVSLPAPTDTWFRVYAHHNIDSDSPDYGVATYKIETAAGVLHSGTAEFDNKGIPLNVGRQFAASAYVSVWGYVYMDDYQFTSVPEPATMVLLGIGGLGVLIRRRRRA